MRGTVPVPVRRGLRRGAGPVPAFTPIGRFGAEHREDTLGSLIADSYVYAVQQAEGADYVPVDFAVVAAG